MSIVTELDSPSTALLRMSSFTPPIVQRPHVLLSAKRYNENRKCGDEDLNEFFLREHLLAYRYYLAGRGVNTPANDHYAEQVLDMLTSGRWDELPPLANEITPSPHNTASLPKDIP